MKALDRTIEAWAKEYRASLEPEIRRLIVQANWDLFYGPGCPDADDDRSAYPGFETAMDQITRALDDVPSVLYVNTDAECWTETAPETVETCWECNGETPDEPCAVCRGDGVIETSYPDTYQVDRSTLVRALLGSELAGSL